MNDPVENPRIARNVLTNAALIRLTDWARQNVESCQTLSNKTLATMAGETLNLHLTGANIASALEAVNITKIKPKAPPTLEERIAELEITVANHAVHLSALHANVNQLIRLVDELERAKPPGWNKSSPGIAEQLKLDQAQYTPPEPTQIQILATDGPITVTTPMLRPGETLHGLSDLDTAVAEVKAERERDAAPFTGPGLTGTEDAGPMIAEALNLAAAAGAIGGEP